MVERGGGAPAVRLVGVSKRFPGSTDAAVESLSLAVPHGSVVALLGPSGCGKTTTLRMINRLIEPSSGHIEIQGRDSRTIDPVLLRRGIGYVMQSGGLFPHRTIADNIAVVPRILRWDRPRVRARVMELADLVGLEPDQLRRYPDELSGGQQQRASVARALAADPPILLMDEPFGAVDPVVRANLQRELLALQARLRKTIVLVTHDLDEAVFLADRIALLDRGGRLAQFDTPEELLRLPADASVARFLGSDRNLRRLSLHRLDGAMLDSITVVTAASSLSSARARLATEGRAFVGVVSDRRFLGLVPAEGLAGEGVCGDRVARDGCAPLGPEDTLRSALDALIAGPAAAVPVLGADGAVLGAVTMRTVRAALAEADL
jgi:osmoprotectant transport system ATP-binding protein